MALLWGPETPVHGWAQGVANAPTAGAATRALLCRRERRGDCAPGKQSLNGDVHKVLLSDFC